MDDTVQPVRVHVCSRYRLPARAARPRHVSSRHSYTLAVLCTIAPTLWTPSLPAFLSPANALGRLVCASRTGACVDHGSFRRRTPWFEASATVADLCATSGSADAPLGFSAWHRHNTVDSRCARSRPCGTVLQLCTRQQWRTHVHRAPVLYTYAVPTRDGAREAATHLQTATITLRT